METSPVKLDIGPFRDQADREILRRVRSSVSACERRDDILRRYALQVDGLSAPYSPGPWLNSCQTDDPLTLEHVLSHVSWLMAATQGEPACLIEAVSPDKEELASTLEGAFNAKLQQWRIHEMKYDLAYNATVFPYAPVRVSWRQKLVKHRTQFEDVVTGEMKDTAHSVVLSDGPDLVTQNPTDIYFYPPNAQSFEEAEQVAEKMFFNYSSLHRGIQEFGFEKEMVDELIEKGPTGYFVTEGERERKDEQDGTDRDEHDGVYECYLVWGRMPVLVEDGEITTPPHLLDENFCWMVCPKHDIVFKWHPSPYPFLPYDVAHICRYPGRIMGRCVPQILEALQEEKTALLRTTINIAEFTSQPVMKQPEALRNDADARDIFPGAKVFYPGMNPGVVDFMQIPTNGLQMLMERDESLQRRAADVLGAGEGITQMAPGSPTATETNAVNGNSQIRRDLFLQTFLASLNRIYKMIFVMWMTHMSETGESVVTEQGAVNVEKNLDIADFFIFTASANSAAGNPQLRLQQAKMNDQTLRLYAAGIMQFPAKFWPMLYHSARRQLSANDERSVESWIGKEPKPGDPDMVLMQLVQQLGQMAQSKGPEAELAQQILQEIQQLMSGDQGGMDAQHGAQGIDQNNMGTQEGQSGMPMAMPQQAPNYSSNGHAPAPGLVGAQA